MRPLLAALLAFSAAASAQPTPARVLASDPWCERPAATDRAWHCEVRETVLSADALTVTALANGALSVTEWDRPDVLVRARIQAEAGSDAEARRIVNAIRIAVGGGDIRAEPGTRGMPDREVEGATVAFEVFAPRRTDLTLEAVNGPVAVRGMVGAIRARVTNGPVALDDVAGDVHVKALNGPVHVGLGGARWDGAGLAVETLNGPITVAVPRDYSARVEVSTDHGRIRTSGLSLNGAGRTDHALAGVLGDGGETLRFRTRNGPVTVEATD